MWIIKQICQISIVSKLQKKIISKINEIAKSFKEMRVNEVINEFMESCSAKPIYKVDDE